MTEVVVTARRRDEDLQKVPLAVSAINGADLKRQNVVTSSDLQFSVPGVTFTGVAGTREDPPISMRGQGQTFGGALPSVQSYYNEIPIDGSVSTLFDMASVQVVKGPQGTLFGRNTTGGAILYTTARPTDHFEGYMEGRAGNLHYTDVEGAVNLPISDKVALRIAGDTLRRRGYTRDLTTGRRLDDQHRDSWRVSLSLKPTDAIESEAFVTGYSVHQNGNSEILYSLGPAAFPGAPAGGFAGLFFPMTSYLAQQQANGNRTTWTPPGLPNRFIRDYWLIGDKTSIKLGDDLTLQNIIGYQQTKGKSTANLGGIPGTLLVQGAPNILNPRDKKSGSLQFSDEVHLTGLSLGGKLNWVIGASYIRSRPTGFYVQAVDVLSPLAGLQYGHTVSKDYGAFVHGTYDLSDWVQGLKFTAGVRYSENKQTITALAGQTLPGNGFSCSLPGFLATTPASQCIVQQSAKFKAPSWNVSLDWQVDPSTLLYVASRRGFKAGGFNYTSNDPQSFKYGAEYLTDVELGAKGTWHFGDDFVMRASADGYYSKVKHIQRFVFYTAVINNVLTGLTATRNVGDGTVKGLEFQGAAVLWRNFEISANYAYTDAKIQPSAQYGAAAGTSFGGVAKHAGNVTALVRAPINPELGDLSVSATLYAQSKMPFLDNIEVEPQAIARAYSLVNLRADWKGVYGSKIDVGLFANNVTNKQYLVDGIIGINQSFGFSVHSFGAPRTYGIDVKYHWD